MVNKKQLSEFLVKAKKATYAAGDKAKEIAEEDKSKTLIFAEGDWKYHDNYFGGEPFGGREAVFYKNEPVYLMLYYGKVFESVNNSEPVYKFLRAALSLISKDKPFRGPKEYNAGNLFYTNNFIGEVDDFSGEETISRLGKEIYRARYTGGFINQRK